MRAVLDWTIKECKWAFNEASLTPWCHAVIHFEVKMSRFSATFKRAIRIQLGPRRKS